MECFLVEEKKIWLDWNEVCREEKEKEKIKKEIFTMISEESKDVVMTSHDCCDEDIVVCNDVSFDYMKKLSKKQMKKFPMLVVEGIVCQSFYISRFEKCSGCDNAISGCEKIFDAGCN
jgi:hypothetical protein